MLEVRSFSSGPPGLGDRCWDGPALSLPAVVPGDEPREKIELLTYFGKRPPGVLHCTTKFCDYGKAAGAEEYAQQDVSPP